MDETKPRRNWLLIVSLCLNVALIGGIAVVVWRVSHLDAGGSGPMSPRALMAEFPDRQPAIQKIIDAHRETIVGLRQDAAHARRDVFRELNAPDYAPQKMQTALNAMVVADTAVERQAVATAGETLATLSPAERQTLVDRIKARNRSWFYRMWRRQGRR